MQSRYGPEKRRLTKHTMEATFSSFPRYLAWFVVWLLVYLWIKINFYKKVKNKAWHARGNLALFLNQTYEMRNLLKNSFVFLKNISKTHSKMAEKFCADIQLAKTLVRYLTNF